MAALEIKQTVIDGISYYTTVSRGVQYTLHLAASYMPGKWELHSDRLSLGRMNVGTPRWFDSLKDIEESLKAFVGISQLIEE